MKKKFSLILLAVLLVLVMATCVACGDPDTPDTPSTGGDGGGSTVQFSVVLNAQNGTDPVTVKVDKGSVGDFGVPERECYVFTGWYTNKSCTAKYDETAPVNSSLMLYAGWELDPNHTHSYAKDVVAATCTKAGYTNNVCKCGDSYKDAETDPIGHDFHFDDADFFSMVTCSREGCESASRQDSLNTYKDVFEYTYNDEKKAEIAARHQSLLEMLEEAEDYNESIHGYTGDKTTAYYLANQAFEEVYNAFYDDLMYLTEQYQYAYVFYCVDEKAYSDAYETVSEDRTNLISDFYALYRLIYETQFREFFYDKIEGGWTDEEIAQALTMSDSYGGEEYAAINNRISEIEIAFRELNDPSNDMKAEEGQATVPELYEEFVSLQNQLAAIAGYDSYIDYAYENVYDREYSPEQVAGMRKNVKKYLKDVYNVIVKGYMAILDLDPLEKGTDAEKYYNALSTESIFKSKVTTDLVKEYFKVMNSTAGEQDIDFLYHANELFKNGNYYTGKYQGAFNYWISAQETSILYFGPGSYSGAFTFVHEFGHYYADKYTNGISMSYDLAETHSQGDEMLLLSFIEDHLPNSVLREMYNRVYFENLFNMFAIIMLATAVDEFEYCVYNSVDLDGNATTYTAKDYDGLFATIMSSYGISGTLNSAYWRYVVIEAPCYYISYAMSALPCVELYSVAETQGFDAAKEIYLKLFTFTDDPANVEVDEYGDKTISIGYGETLEYVGLHSIFDENMYKALNTYFCENEKDFSYPDAE